MIAIQIMPQTASCIALPCIIHAWESSRWSISSGDNRSSGENNAGDNQITGDNKPRHAQCKTTLHACNT